MSVQVSSAVWERFVGSPMEKFIALALAEHAHPDGTHIYPSIARVARMTGQSERTVQRVLKKFRENGWLLSVAGAKGGRQVTHHYRVNPSWLAGSKMDSGAPQIPSQSEKRVTGCHPLPLTV